jgi:hypothetical protein
MVNLPINTRSFASTKNPEGKKVGKDWSALLVEGQVEDLLFGQGLLDEPELVLDLRVVEDRFDNNIRV